MSAEALTVPSSPDARIDLRTGLAWGAGRFASILFVTVFALLVLYYLVDVAKIDPGLAGAMVFAARMFDIVASPSIGAFSDKIQTRWGRRRPFLLVGGVLGAIATLMIFNVPHFAHPIGKIVFVEAALLVYTVGYATMNIPHMAMANEITTGAPQRISLMSYGTVLMVFGGLAAGAVCPFLIQSFGDGQRGYAAMSVFVAVAILVAMIACFFGLARAPFVRETQTSGSFREAIGEFAKNRPAVLLVLVRLSTGCLVAGQTSIILFFTRAIIKLPVSALSFASLCSSAGQFAAVPLWLWLARRVGNKRGFLVSNILGSLIGMSWFLAHGGESLLFFCLRYTAFGIMASGATMLGLAMMTDVIEYDQIVSGRRREGIFNSVFSFVEKTSAALGVLLSGFVLSAGGFQKSLGPTHDQPPHAVAALYIVVALMPAIGFLLSFAVLSRFYRLDPVRAEAPAPDERAAFIAAGSEVAIDPAGAL